MLKKLSIKKKVPSLIGYLIILTGFMLFNHKNMMESINDYFYIAYLKIPKINLIKGLVNKNSKFNNVDKNIQIIKESDMPDIVNGNLILAAHSGNSNISYFKDLNKLGVDDSIYIEYNNKQYGYKITDYYIVEKTGLVDIIRDENKTILTLITCVRNTNKQLVLICELYEIANL